MRGIEAAGASLDRRKTLKLESLVSHATAHPRDAVMKQLLRHRMIGICEWMPAIFGNDSERGRSEASGRCSCNPRELVLLVPRKHRDWLRRVSAGRCGGKQTVYRVEPIRFRRSRRAHAQHLLSLMPARTCSSFHVRLMCETLREDARQQLP